MNTGVYSTLGPHNAAEAPPGVALREALDHVGREDWMSAYHTLQRTIEQAGDQRCAHFMLWEVCQVLGHPDVAMANLQAVLHYSPVTSRACATPRRRVLMLAVPGDFQANLPLGALLNAMDTELHTLWLVDPETILRDPDSAFAGDPPPFDCVFIAIAEDVRHRQALLAADRLAETLGVPIINRGHRIAAVSRAGSARLLQNIPNAIVPIQVLMDRSSLVGDSASALAEAGLRFPLIIRPRSAHAGKNLARVESFSDLRVYLDGVADPEFYVAPFVDYRGADGLWRKYRVIFVNGRPWPYHLAIHTDWAVWYYNARMELDEGKRLEEARFVQDIGTCFPPKALRALTAIGERVGLDYFGIDCGVMPDGSVVVFEIETGMIVHDWDNPALYPYKADCARSIAQAVEAMIDTAIVEQKYR